MIDPLDFDALDVLLDGNTRLIRLRGQGGVTRGYTILDAADRDLLGDHFWFLSPYGYAQRTFKTGSRQGTYPVYMHRELLGLEKGDPRQGHHRNGHKLDNRRSNLQIVTPADNTRLHKKPRRGVSSQYRGVTQPTGYSTWTAQAKFHGEYYRLGAFRREDDAAQAVNDFWVSHGYEAPNHIPQSEAA